YPVILITSQLLTTGVGATPEPEPPATEGDQVPLSDEPHEPRKFYVHGGPGDIDTEVTYELDADGSKLRTVQITQYTGETVRSLFTDPDDLRQQWSDFEQRSAVVELF